MVGFRSLRKSQSDHELPAKLAEQRLQWPHTTKNTDFTKTCSKKSLNQQHEWQEVATKNPGRGEGKCDIQRCQIIIFKAITFQQKITSDAKEEENMAHSQDKRKLIEAIPEEAQT